MRAPISYLFILVLAATAACNTRRINVEKELVDQVLTEFTTERILHHLHGNGPKSNAEIMERVLKRHSLRLIEFSPAFKRYLPEIHNRLLSETPVRR